MNSLIVLLLMPFLFFSLTASVPTNNNELLSVIVIYRHGDRAPVILYPNDPYDMSYWPDGLGALDNRGKQRHYRLGKFFRKRYDGFLSRTYSSSEIRIESTDVDRVLMSASAHLAGLYPPIGDQVWHEQINWQPIPVHTANTAVLNSLDVCPKLMKLHSNLFSSTYFQSLDKNNEDLYKYLSEHSGLNVTDLLGALLLRDTLFVENHNGLILPDWTHDVYSQLEPLAGLYYGSYGHTDEMLRLSTGPFLQNVVSHFEKISINQTGLQKVLMYSGHDINIASVLSGLGAFTTHCPYYASTVFFELSRKNNEHVVNVFYKNQEDIVPIQVKGCTTNCKLDQFRMNLKNIAISPNQWISECYMSTTQANRLKAHSSRLLL